MEERRLADRVNAMEIRLLEHKAELDEHVKSHAQFEKSLAENTALTKTIAENTSELVQLVKGAKGFRTFIVWSSPIIVALAAAWAWIKTH